MAVVVCGELRWVWCDGCATSSRSVADVLVLTGAGVVRVGEFDHCPRCAGRPSSNPVTQSGDE